MLGPSDSAITLSQRNLLQKLVCSLFKNIVSFNPAFLMTDTIYEAIINNN